MKNYKTTLPLMLLALTLLLTLPGIAAANANGTGLTPHYQVQGNVSYSADGLGQLSPGGTIQAEVPAGSTVLQAFLYGTFWNTATDDLSVAERTVNFDGTNVVTEMIVDSGFLLASRADVTTQVAAKVGSGGGITDFVINNSTVRRNGVALVVVYENPSLPTGTVAILDGSASPTGDTAYLNLAAPLDKTVPNFSAILSLGIGHGFQSGSQHVCGSGQISTIDINSSRLTSCAGSYDDGVAANGALITVGGVGDDLQNPPDPNGPGGTDDELYNIEPFLNQGDTVIQIDSQNPSGDDNLFLSIIQIAAQAVLTAENCDDNIDNDGDGLIDGDDPDCVTEPDNDGDGIPDEEDPDDDNDGQSDEDELACGSDPLDEQSVASDVDEDGSPDCVDPDFVSCDVNHPLMNVIHGTPKNDKLKGTPGNDIILGYGGNDRIEGMGGNDCLVGGDGNDQLFGNDGHDIMWGGDVNNATTYTRDNDKLWGGNGDDEMHGGDRDDRLQGDDGDDMMWGDGRRDKLYGNDGNDTMYGGDDRDTLHGGEDNDTMAGGAGDDYLNGDDGDDHLEGDEGRDKLFGGHGDDYLDGGSEDDTLQGSRGEDELWGGPGKDRLDGGHEDDRLYGEEGDDQLFGGRDDDMLDGGPDNDRLDGSNGTDTCTTGETLKSCEL